MVLALEKCLKSGPINQIDAVVDHLCARNLLDSVHDEVMRSGMVIDAHHLVSRLQKRHDRV
jgi:hypothetical protein